MHKHSTAHPLLIVSGALACAMLFATGCPLPDREQSPAEPDSTEETTAAESDPASGGDEAEHVPNEPAEPGGYGHSSTKTPATDVNLFEDWPQPVAAILISGEQIGFMEPCGWAGLGNQKGGLKRRHTLIKQLREKDWPLVTLDLGGLIRRFGRQAEIKFRRTIQALAEMDYDAVGFGPQELRLPAGELLVVIANLAEGDNPFVAANVGLEAFDNGFVARYRVIEAGGRRIGITSVLGDEYQKWVNNEGIVLMPAAESLKEVVPRLQGEADFLVLLAHANPEESTALAKQFPEFDVVITAGGAQEPPREPAAIEGTDARLIEVGHKGMYVAVLGLYDDKRTPLRYQRVPLDARFADSPAMQQMLVDYQEELKDHGLAGLGLTGQAHPTGRKFVGSETCSDCHTKAHDVWHKTPHAHATETLTKLNPPRHFDPECLSCHTTGWDPQNYFPYASGYTGLEKTAHLVSNGCENCHGPGSQHAAAELGELNATDDQMAEFRDQMRLPLAKAEAKCVECHDLDNSPDFKFETYWPEVEHRGKN